VIWNKTKTTHQLFHAFTDAPKIFWPSGLLLTFLPCSPEMWQTWVLQQITGIFRPHFSLQEGCLHIWALVNPPFIFY
jgi:hypothetical protein